MKKPTLIALLTLTVTPLHAADLSDLTWTTTNGEVTISNCETTATGELVIPDTIEGNPVTSIGGNAFQRCRNLTSITIPGGVISIGGNAFDSCASLTSFTIPEGVTEIGAYAFIYCDNLTSIVIPDSVTSIGPDCFYKTPITNLEIPSRFCLDLAYLDISSELSYQKLMEFTTSNEVATAAITTEINQIKEQLAGAGGISPEQAAAITANTKSINDIRNAIFIEGSSIIPALIFNDQEQRNSITGNTTKINELDGVLATADETLEAFSQNLDILNENDQSIGEQLTTLGENDISIGEQMTILGQNDQSISEQMATLSENNESIMAEINAMKAQLQTLVASVAEKDAQIAEKDAKIAELEQGGGGQSLEQVLEQVRDARAGSVVLTVDPDGDNITLGLTIEQSDNLTQWTKLDGEMTRTIPIPDGKKFYRFALDK